MAILLLTHPVELPIARLRAALAELGPEISWRIGDDDDGSDQQSIPFERAQTILGRSGDALMMIALELRRDAYLPDNGHQPPAHILHVRIARPTLADEELARGLTLAVGTTLAVCGDERALLQLAPGENWLDVTDMRSLFKMLGKDRALSLRHRYGRPEAGGEPAADPAPPLPDGANPPGRLGSFTFLLDGDVLIDWKKMDEAMNAIDPGGNWMSIAAAGGMGFIRGRAKVTAIWSPMPYDMRAIAEAYQRSFWFDGDADRVARHRQYITLAIDAPEDFDAKVQTAKAMTILVGLLSRLPQVSAVFNNMVSTLFSPANVHAHVSVLHSDEVPIALWTWAAPDRLEDGNVSISTGGLEPFLGYEVELWNAPHPVAVAGEKLNGVLRYLLINGPVVAHGDTIGTSSSDQSVRCFFGDSRANRPVPVKAMLLEFDVGTAEGPPRPDLPAPPQPEAPPAIPPKSAFGFLRRPGGFGRKGL